MCKILFCFLNQSDLNAAHGEGAALVHTQQLSPIVHALQFWQHRKHESQWNFNKIVIINFYQPNLAAVDRFFQWISSHPLAGQIIIERYDKVLDHINDFTFVYNAILNILDHIDSQYLPILIHRIFFLNPEQPMVTAVGLLLGKTIREARLLQWRGEKNPQIAELDPAFEISANNFLAKSQATSSADDLGEVHSDVGDMVHSSALMKKVLERAEYVAQFPVPVLITGESGTGKTKLAHIIHRHFFKDAFKKHPFVVVNCGAIPKDIFESELFGSTKGAFTGAMNDRKGLLREVHGGTLFLDEIAELSLASQSKLLRVLETKRARAVGDTKEYQVEFRLICATHQNLRKLVSEGRFREDLFYRLAVVTIAIPPLRDRPDDLRPLVTCLLRRVSQRLKQPLTLRLHKDTWSLLRNHHWRGNVRELENVLTQAILWRTHSDSLYVDDLKDFINLEAQVEQKDSVEQKDLNVPINDWNLPKAIDEVRQRYIVQALQKSSGNHRKAARILGLNHVTFLNWVKRLKLAS